METVDIIRLLLNAFELAAAVAGLVCWRKVKGTHWQWLVILLWVIFITEITAKIILIKGSHPEYNQFLYKYINIPVMFAGFIYLLLKDLYKEKFRRPAGIILGVYVAAFLTEELLFKNTFRVFGTLSYQLGCLAVLTLAVIRFLQFTNSREILFFRNRLSFWVPLGIIVYLVTTLPFMAFRNSLFAYNYQTGLQLWYVTIFFNVLMYSSFIAGFILYRPEQENRDAKN